MKKKLTVVIPTCKRSTLLDRTLKSINESEIPEALSRIIVVENGKQYDAKEVVARNLKCVPIEYKYFEEGNKSKALNYVLEDVVDDLVVFFDDDIRIEKSTLLSYAKLLVSEDYEFFAGGTCLADYESEPPNWFKDYLPPSAKGWSLGDRQTELRSPDALGFNWCAFASTIKRLGGFNPHRGPGTASRGQESDMQIKMLNAGVPGIFIPGARVWHYVPRERCDEKWALERARLTARTCGVELAKRNVLSISKHKFLCFSRILIAKILLRSARREDSVFKHTYSISWNSGIIEGVGLSKSFNN